MEKPLSMKELVAAAGKALELPTAPAEEAQVVETVTEAPVAEAKPIEKRSLGGQPVKMEMNDPSLTMALWNEERIMRLTSGDLDFVGTLLSLFAGEVKERLELIEEALAPGGDLTIADRETHAIKGSASNLGGDRLEYVANRMVQAARGGDRAKCKGDLDRLKQEVADLIEVVDKATKDA